MGYNVDMDILKNTQFLKLWGNQVLLQIAFNMCNFTALLLLFELSSSRFVLAQFYAAMTLPAFFVGLFAGCIVDMSNRKKLMLGTDLLLSLLFFLYAFSTGHYWIILLIGFLSATVAQFFTPAEAATIPLIVKEEQLEKANALFLFTGLGSVMLGYALAGPVVQLFGGIQGGGAEAAFRAAALLTGFGFLLRLSLKTIETSKPKIVFSEIFSKSFGMIREVVAETKGNIKISLPIGLLTIMEFNIGMLAILFLDYVKEYLSLPTTSTSYVLVLPLIAGLGLGVSLMGILQKRWRRGKMIFLAGLSFGLVILSLGLGSELLSRLSFGTILLRLLTIITSSVVGMAAVFIAVHSRTILQENTPKPMLGRVFSLVTISASAVTPIPVLAVSVLTERLDVSVIFIIFGLFLTFGALAGGRILSRKIA